MKEKIIHLGYLSLRQSPDEEKHFSGSNLKGIIARTKPWERRREQSQTSEAEPSEKRKWLYVRREGAT
jgi:hypothetical protein